MSLQIVLKNNTDSPSLFAHITGRDDTGIFMLSADGQTPYHPQSPSKILQPLGADTAIGIGGPGATRTVRIPYIFGARIWFCQGRPLTFLLNPGPAVVEPSATNPSDLNYNLDWGFCELTYNRDQLYVNISYVDFISLPISLRLENQAGKVTKVPGLPRGALGTVCDKLKAQGGSWGRLVIKHKSGRNLRALSPNAGSVLYPDLFKDYYKPHVDAVWDKYKTADLTINTQKFGDVKGRTDASGKITFPGIGSFAKPSARDIWSCNSGPFDHFPGVSEKMLNIGARISAALNRSTLLMNSRQPEGEKVKTYYKEKITNHYSRICHEVTIEGRGYAFPYDDVGASDGPDQSGFLNDGAPKVLTVVVGGPKARKDL
ncbi:Fc.00g075970.m01.CDS01 [Cosmosporella sp. VM-42]